MKTEDLYIQRKAFINELILNPIEAKYYKAMFYRKGEYSGYIKVADKWNINETRFLYGVVIQSNSIKVYVFDNELKLIFSKKHTEFSTHFKRYLMTISTSTLNVVN
ncbi:hypothetical protein GCM10023149_29070 [Mucilaginibacter gynuensis]|uniref:Uncharacterized protein n=1 Tax=Mucilaginibacter gynuensis TaxID=1302236 RepID=A0ABP8GL22_9SPHI